MSHPQAHPTGTRLAWLSAGDARSASHGGLTCLFLSTDPGTLHFLQYWGPKSLQHGQVTFWNVL